MMDQIENSKENAQKEARKKTQTSQMLQWRLHQRIRPDVNAKFGRLLMQPLQDYWFARVYWNEAQ